MQLAQSHQQSQPLEARQTDW